MTEKRFRDYLDPFIPVSVQLMYAANIFACLKFAGELQGMDWGFIILIYALGMIGRLVKAAIKQADDRDGAAPAADHRHTHA